MSDLLERLRDPRFKGQEAMRASAADEIERLRALLHRMYDWASASNDWRPDAKLGRDIRALLDGQQHSDDR